MQVTHYLDNGVRPHYLCNWYELPKGQLTRNKKKVTCQNCKRILKQGKKTNRTPNSKIYDITKWDKFDINKIKMVN